MTAACLQWTMQWSDKSLDGRDYILKIRSEAYSIWERYVEALETIDYIDLFEFLKKDMAASTMLWQILGQASMAFYLKIASGYQIP